jgi:hypothetical protein
MNRLLGELPGIIQYMLPLRFQNKADAKIVILVDIDMFTQFSSA